MRFFDHRQDMDYRVRIANVGKVSSWFGEQSRVGDYVDAVFVEEKIAMQRGSLLIRFNLPKSLIPRTQCLSTLLLVGKLNYIFKKKTGFWYLIWSEVFWTLALLERGSPVSLIPNEGCGGMRANIRNTWMLYYLMLMCLAIKKLLEFQTSTEYSNVQLGPK